MMAKILALDIGERRVGLAVSDDLNLTAQPAAVLERRPHQKFLKRLAEAVQRFGADRVLLGLPRRTDGSLGPEAQKVLALAREIKSGLGIAVITHDESYSTCQAHEILDEARLTFEERRRVVDKLAAAIILQSYLDQVSKRVLADDDVSDFGP